MPRKKKKEEAIVQPESKVIESNLDEIVEDRFGRYSKYIIQERALPDARDGLKPVQRRILWAKYEDGNTFDKPYRKSAKTVGNVIGNYHPHGDTSVYDAIVRMSQDWKAPFPLIDMQGNNGSIDDDPAAAMRYTEARLSKIAGFLLEDIDRETVEWSPNFSDDKMEPIVLPARYPQLLVSGISGIAAGYATNIPPHNLGEVLEACIYRIDHPKSTSKDLLQFVKGPDFPTGGLVMGKEGIEEALTKGRGRVTVRSKAEIVESRTINQIVITEIPYEVVKSALVRKMDEIRLNNKVNGILDVRDESDRMGLRIVLDLKKEANADAVLNYLYKNTDLQIYYHYNVIAIVNQTPRQLGLADMIDAFLNHREEIILRRSRYDLNQKKKREHIVEGLIRAVSVLDEIITLIRQSKGKADSKKRLVEHFDFTEAQAEAIVTLQLYRLSNTDVLALEEEARKLAAEIKELEEILSMPKKRKTLMKKELREIEKLFPSPRKSKIVEEEAEIVLDERDMIADEQVMVVASKQGYVKRVSLRSYQSSSGLPGLKEGDEVLGCAELSTLDNLYFFTSRGKLGIVPVYSLEEKKWKEMGAHFSSLFKTGPNETITAMLAGRKPFEGQDLVMVSACGQIRRSSTSLLPTKTGRRLAAQMDIADGDEMIAVLSSVRENDEIVLISQDGFGVRYSLDQISFAKGKSKGVRGMNLVASDRVAGAMVASDENEKLILENSQGQFKKIDLSELAPSKRPSKGIRMFKPSKTNPVSIFDARLIDKDGTLEFNDFSTAPLTTGALSKMKPASTWTSAGMLDEPLHFQNPPLSFQAGQRIPTEETAIQESLFDLNPEA